MHISQTKLNNDRGREGELLLLSLSLSPSLSKPRTRNPAVTRLRSYDMVRAVTGEPSISGDEHRVAAGQQAQLAEA